MDSFKNRKFIINTPVGCGGTLLSNIVAGLVQPGAPIVECWLKDIHDKLKNQPDQSVFRSYFDQNIYTEWELRFITAIDPERGWDIHKRWYNKVHVFIMKCKDLPCCADGILIDDNLTEIIHTIAEQMQQNFKLDFPKECVTTAIRRLSDMNDRLHEIKKLSSHYYDEFYGMHGSCSDTAMDVLFR